MSHSFDFSDRIAVVTGVGGTLGSAVADAFLAADGTVAGIDVMDADSEELSIETGRIDYYRADLTDESAVAETVESIVHAHGGIDSLANVAGTWKGGEPLHETAVDQFDLLFDVNLKTMFLTSKHALPHLQEREGTIVSVSARSSLEGGAGDGLYRASKAGVRLLTESIAEENRGTVRANAVMPSVIDTPMNREMMPDADHDAWVDPADIATTILTLCSDATPVTSGAAVPVYGDA